MKNLNDLRRNNHEFLEGKAATGVRTSVQDILEGHRKHVWLLGSSKLGDVAVQRNTLVASSSLGRCHAHPKDSIRTEVRLVGSAIKFVEKFVDFDLVLDIDCFLNEGWTNDFVDVLDSLCNT